MFTDSNAKKHSTASLAARLACGALLLAVLLVPASPAFAAKYAASIGSKRYKTVQSAVDAVKKDQTILLLRDLKDQGTVSVDRRVTFTLDMNRHYYYADTEEPAFILSAGKMTVKRPKKMTGGVLFRVEKGAYLTINSGTYRGKIRNFGTTKINNGTFVNTNQNVLDNSGMMVVADGKFTEKGSTDYYLVSNTKTLVIRGGKFSGCIGTHDGSSPLTTITGGTFSAKKEDNTLYTDEGAKLVVRAGTFTAYGGWYVLYNEGTANLVGGTFTNKYNALWTASRSRLTVGKKVKYSGKIRTDD